MDVGGGEGEKRATGAREDQVPPLAAGPLHCCELK